MLSKKYKINLKRVAVAVLTGLLAVVILALSVTECHASENTFDEFSENHIALHDDASIIRAGRSSAKLKYLSIYPGVSPRSLRKSTFPQVQEIELHTDIALPFLQQIVSQFEDLKSLSIGPNCKLAQEDLQILPRLRSLESLWIASDLPEGLPLKASPTLNNLRLKSATTPLNLQHVQELTIDEGILRANFFRESRLPDLQFLTFNKVEYSAMDLLLLANRRLHRIELGQSDATQNDKSVLRQRFHGEVLSWQDYLPHSSADAPIRGRIIVPRP